MSTKHVTLILSCALSAAFILIGLYAFSPLSKDLTPSSFDRTFTADPLPESEMNIDSEDKNYYIAGVTGDVIWLSNPRKPFTITRANILNMKSEEINIELIGIDSILKPNAFKTVVDSPFFYLSNGVMPTILRGKLGVWKATPFVKYDNYYFADAIAINSEKFVLKAYSQYQQGIQLGLLNAIDTPHFRFNFDLLKKQREGVFSVHGSAHYSPELHNVVYLYAYRNEYLIMDTALNKIKKGNTIDTFTVAPIRVINTDKNGSSMLASPPVIINGKSCVSGTSLYVQSSLLAKNEDKERFLKSTTIDVYDLISTKYINSFRIPNHESSEISDYKIDRGYVIALYSNHIIRFKLNNLSSN